MKLIQTVFYRDPVN